MPTKSFTINLNKDEQYRLCMKWKCTTNDLMKVLKAIILEKKESPYYRELGITQEKKGITKQDMYEYLMSKSPSEILLDRADAINWLNPRYVADAETPVQIS